MSRKCQISGKKTGFGHTVSHSNIKTKRRFHVNIVSKKVFLAHENRWVRLKLSTRMLRTLNKKGVVNLMKKYGQDQKVLYTKSNTPLLTEVKK